ncbi:MAG: ribosome maturation factor RimM [Janthinobacterium lividum]
MAESKITGPFVARRARSQPPKAKTAESVAAVPQQVAQQASAKLASVPGSNADPLPDDLIELGIIVQAYGVKGGVKIAPHASAGRGGDALPTASFWWLSAAGITSTEPRRYRVLEARWHSGSIVARLEGLSDRDAAERMRGTRISVRRTDFPGLDDDEYYWVDLIGLDVVSIGGEALGKVVDLLDNGAHSVLRIEYPTTDEKGVAAVGERLIPFVGVYVQAVDLAQRRITVDWSSEY